MISALLGWVLLASHLNCVTVRIVACGSYRTITATVALDTVDLCADVRVEPHPDHRWLQVSWDIVPESPDFLQGGAGQRDLTSPGTLDPPSDPTPERAAGAVGLSKMSLDGDKAAIRPRPRGFSMEGLRGGTYEVVALVGTGGGTPHGRATARVQVR